MAHYRLYLLGPDRRIASAVDLDCEDDDTAVAEAQATTDKAFELWARNRLVFSRPGPKTPR